MIILPRQARDKHRENSTKRFVFLQSPPCDDIAVTCAATGDTMVTGPVASMPLLQAAGGAGGEAASNAGGLLRVSEAVVVDDCYEHLPDMGNSWPQWKAQAFGLLQNKSGGSLSSSRASSGRNMLDLSQNLPLWYGPWASGLVVVSAQDPGSGSPALATLKWSDAEQGGIVAHAMADGGTKTDLLGRPLLKYK